MNKVKNFRIEDLIVFENNDFLAINKPPDISTLDERDPERPSILGKLRESYSDYQICHRLDKETSGLLLISKRNDVYRTFTGMFEKREITKWYHGIAEGNHVFRDFEIDKPIKISSKGYSRINYREGKESLTIVNTEETFMHFTLLRCYPFTGRLHQIRVHLQSQNASLAGDPHYGGHYPMLSELKRKFNLSRTGEETPMISRVALHARSLHFTYANEKFDLEAPYPKDFDIFLKLLRKYDSNNF
ncbi:MAG: RluA family pseudouridine synthase [Flavobacteriales bacterium]|nr:RluA family pseudouridine synthase [Flavobacteriales bacterium]